LNAQTESVGAFRIIAGPETAFQIQPRFPKHGVEVFNPKTVWRFPVVILESPNRVGWRMHNSLRPQSCLSNPNTVWRFQ